MHGRRAWVLLAGVAMAIAAGLLMLPTGSSQSCTTSGDGPEVCREARTSLLSTQGPGVLLVLIVPAILCLLPALMPRRGTPAVTTAALLLFCLVAALSVGVFYVPVAVSALVLAVRSAAPGPGLGRPKAAAS